MTNQDKNLLRLGHLICSLHDISDRTRQYVTNLKIKSCFTSQEIFSTLDHFFFTITPSVKSLPSTTELVTKSYSCNKNLIRLFRLEELTVFVIITLKCRLDIQ